MEYRLASLEMDDYELRPSTYYLNHPIHIEIGNLVKLDFQYRPGRYERFSGENMWVLVTEIHGQYFVGNLDNDPFERVLKYGSRVVFCLEHIVGNGVRKVEWVRA